MTCACDTNEKGAVASPCGAHSEWFRRILDENELKRKTVSQEDYQKVLRDANYQRKRADFFERLLVEGKPRE